MAAVRDPAFWKRFSTAVHLDEEQGSGNGMQEMKRSDSWLARANRKNAHAHLICWVFWPCLLILVAAVVGVVVWLLRSGTLGGAGAAIEPAATVGDS